MGWLWVVWGLKIRLLTIKRLEIVEAGSGRHVVGSDMCLWERVMYVFELVLEFGV